MVILRSTGAPIGVVGNPIPVAAGTIASVTTASPAPWPGGDAGGDIDRMPKEIAAATDGGPVVAAGPYRQKPSAAATRSAGTVIVAIIWLGVAASATASPIVFTTCTRARRRRGRGQPAAPPTTRPPDRRRPGEHAVAGQPTKATVTSTVVKSMVVSGNIIGPASSDDRGCGRSTAGSGPP